jgi:hypothetical protein
LCFLRAAVHVVHVPYTHPESHMLATAVLDRIHAVDDYSTPAGSMQPASWFGLSSTLRSVARVFFCQR